MEIFNLAIGRVTYLSPENVSKTVPVAVERDSEGKRKRGLPYLTTKLTVIEIKTDDVLKGRHSNAKAVHLVFVCCTDAE